MEQADSDKYVQAAEEQARKVRETQAVTVDKVTPLHISVPIRGMRYAFSQALWMPGDTPMTVTMKASGIGQVGVGRTVAIVVLLFASIMVFVGGWIHRSRIALIAGTILLAMSYLFVLFG
jgi:hypothetical protein